MSNSENYSDKNISSNSSSSGGNEADLGGAKVYDKDIKEILSMS